MTKPLAALFYGLLIAATLAGSAAIAERPMYQWIDKQGIDNWADKNPLTDPSKRPKQAVDANGRRVLPTIDSEAVIDFLRSTASEAVPAFCKQRNADNPAQRSICEQFQLRALQRVEAFINDPSNTHSSFIYQRCRGKWLQDSPPDFLRLAQCMGVQV